MNEKDAYIEHLENTIKDLQNQVSNLTEMVLLLRKEKFGSSSEKTPKQIEGQLSLFIYTFNLNTNARWKFILISYDAYTTITTLFRYFCSVSHGI